MKSDQCLKQEKKGEELYIILIHSAVVFVFKFNRRTNRKNIFKIFPICLMNCKVRLFDNHMQSHTVL